MMEITANAVQTVAVNQAVLFTETAVAGNISMIHREGSGLVGLRGLTNGQRRARFLVTYGSNIAVPTGETVGPVSLAIAINGEPVLTSQMISTPAAVDEYHNVGSSIFIDVPIGCCSQISVENTSTIPVNVQNANLIIERVA
jgi:hypothetical protein